MMIYKILRASEWADLQIAGSSAGAPVDIADGYIHLSTAEQVHGTLSKHFAGKNDVMLLACDADDLAADLKWEPSRGGALFPHLYRVLHLSDIKWSRPIALTDAGHETGPLQ
ncbi:DUF952 domain-containing protein [Paracoccus beibuensis]|uniref:DUF952 domain-containing protein n=1 Tax=Paracoccus beibuensis TaxID=547602 RepID=UPI00223F86C4|nr:DUF952 domain-containing protein [Paracoccus beibuensis]